MIINHNEITIVVAVSNSVGVRSDMTDATMAFNANDSSRSIKAHEQKRKRGRDHSDVQHQHEEKHALIGEYVKSIVFGGLDGIITTFAVVAASVASKLSFYTLLIVGFANLIGDAFSMGLGDYFSSRAEVEQAKKLRKQYMWRCEKEPEKQKKIMKQLFIEKGFDETDSTLIVEELGENKKVFADIMLLEIEGVQVEEQSWVEPIKEGVVTFISFIIFGSVPLISFIFAPTKSRLTRPDVYFWISMGLTAVSLFALGALKNALVKKSMLKGGLIMLCQGGVATAVAYLAGWSLEKLFT
jgi:VIT1/CCC1 family predicted Fe2+/Mn2+ transporter